MDHKIDHMQKALQWRKDCCPEPFRIWWSIFVDVCHSIHSPHPCRNASWYSKVYDVSFSGWISIHLSQFHNDWNFRIWSMIRAEIRSIPVVGVTSAWYFNSFCRTDCMAKYKSSFHGVFYLGKARIMPSIWLKCHFTQWSCDAEWLWTFMISTGSSFGLAFKPPWHPSWWANQPVLCRVAGNYGIFDSWAIPRRILAICRLR